MKHIISALAILLALAVPASAQLRPGAFTTVRTTDTSANSLVVGGASGATTGTGGIKAGSVSVAGVGIIGTDGRIPAISSTYFASLSGATITGIVETAITDGSLLARVADAETISGAWTITGSSLTMSNTGPVLDIAETDAAANNKIWRVTADGTTFNLQTVNDAKNATGSILQVARSGNTVSSMTLGAATTIFPAGAVAAPSLALTEAVGTANDSGLYWAAGSLNIGVNGSLIASFNNSSTTLQGGVVTVTAGVAEGATINGTSATPLGIDRSSSDGTMMDIRRAGSSVGSISVAAGVVAYNTFMGAHYTQLQPGQDEFEQGTVMVSAGKAIPMLPRKMTKAILVTDPEAADAGQPFNPDAERFVYVERSSRRNQKGVYGVWFADLGRTAAGMSWGDPDAEVFSVAGLGLYTAWVTDTCGPIANGNLLATSPVPGVAERQCQAGMAMDAKIYDPVVRDHTLGKALIDVDWSKVQPDADGIRKLRIPVILLAG